MTNFNCMVCVKQIEEESENFITYLQFNAK